jgi:hypothetical protein
MSYGAGGYRGAVLLRAGKYKVSSTIKMTKSGVVLRGVGRFVSEFLHLLTRTHAQLRFVMCLH